MVQIMAGERLYLTADRKRLVGEGDKKAATLYAAIGDIIPESTHEQFGLVDGMLKASAARLAKETAAAEAEQEAARKAAQAEAAAMDAKDGKSGENKDGKPGEDKDAGAGENKSGAEAA